MCLCPGTIGTRDKRPGKSLLSTELSGDNTRQLRRPFPNERPPQHGKSECGEASLSDSGTMLLRLLDAVSDLGIQLRP